MGFLGVACRAHQTELGLETFDRVFFDFVGNHVIDEIVLVARVVNAVLCSTRLHEAVTFFDIDDFTVSVDVTHA